MIRRLAVPIAAVTLGVLLLLLAFLQYRWLGQVSDGERQRMRTTLEARARDFAAEFDRDLGKAASAFTVPASDLGADPSAALALCWDKWQATSPNPKLVRAVLVVDRSAPQLALRRIDASTKTLVPSEWPEAFRAMRDRWAAEFSREPATPPASPAPQVPHFATRVFIDDLSDIPALVVPNQPDVLTLNASARASALPGSAPQSGAATPGPSAAVQTANEALVTAKRLYVQQASSKVTIVWLDLDEIRRTLLPSLVRRYFATEDVFDYQVAVLLRRDPKMVFYESDPPGGAGAATRPRTDGDATVPMFRLRFADVFARTPEGAPGSAPQGDRQRTAAPPQGQQRSMTIMRFEATAQGAPRGGAVVALSDTSGGWLLRLVHRAGSLDAAVERLRRRNLVISSTILGLLAASLGFVLVSTRRAQRLAAQQVEFVASVSHELRTPLTVIRSAGENLADGVVDSPEQVRRYGTLIAGEGRKLGAMVEQVMEYAGMQSNEPRWRKEPVDLGSVVADAVAGARRLPEAGDACIEVTVDAGLPAMEADRAALVRAVQNLIENALKYGAFAQAEDGRADAGRGEPSRRDEAASPGSPFTNRSSVGVRVQAVGGSAITIDVSDRGPGIEAAERRKIFEPFVRGRAAAAARVPGNGLGLSIVRRVVEGHGGRVEVRNLADGGACFAVTLPIDS